MAYDQRFVLLWIVLIVTSAWILSIADWHMVVFPKSVNSWKKNASHGETGKPSTRECPCDSMGKALAAKASNTAPTTPDSKVRVLILASMRTGSSFVGELLGNSQDIFYLFEPGLSLLNTLEGLEGQRKVLRSSYLGMLRRLYRCDFKHLDFYLEWLSRRQTLLPKFAPRLHDLCSNSLIRGKCMLTRGMATGSCLQSRYIVVKSIRVRDIMVLLPMMEDSATNLKVIHLLRDPRPTIASRVLAQTKKKVTQLSKSVREYLYLHCKFNLENFELGTRNPYIKNRYMFLRYEDAAMDPLAAAKRMHRFLGHKEVPESVLKWIAANTESKKPALTYSTARNSSEAYRAWRSNLPFDTAKEIEETGECPQMMARLGYHSLEDETHLRNMSRSLVGSIPIGHDDRKYDWVWEL